MVWGVLIGCGLILWASAAGIYAFGREIWPAEMPEAVRLATAPAIASALTVAHKLTSAQFPALTRAVTLTLIVVALDTLVLGPVAGGDRRLLRNPMGWLTFAAILVASWITGVFVPM